MTYQEFENKWLGKRVDYDGVYQYQCVDLIKQYLHEVFDMRPGAWGNAIDYWTKTNPTLLTKFDKVSGTPQTGDIVIYNGNSGNPYGHIGIAKNATQTLEQNGSTGNGSGTGGDAIRLRSIPTSRLAGILRPKGDDMTLSTEAVKTLYRRLFNREGDAGGVKNYTGKTLDFALKDMVGSKEFKALHTVNNTVVVEKPVEVIKEVVKEVIVEKPVEVIREVERVVEKPVPLADLTARQLFEALFNKILRR